MSEYVFILICCVFSVLWMALWLLPVIWDFQHKKRMRKYISQVRKALDGVLLNKGERLLLQACFEAMECIGLRDEVIADYQASKDEKLQRVLDVLGAVLNEGDQTSVKGGKKVVKTP